MRTAPFGPGGRPVAVVGQGTWNIPKSSHVEHVEANAAAADLELGDDELARIDAAFPRGPRREGVPVL